MAETEEILAIIPQVETLEMDVKKFAEGLPYWSKYLADKILSGNSISDADIDTSYNYLLEEQNLKDATEKPVIIINYNNVNAGAYKQDLLLTRLQNVEGVNALTENQIIEFSPNLTIIYGANGSGKSGYVRLMKQVFYSKAKENILSNIHIETTKPINAEFIFRSNNTDISLKYENKDNVEFEQLAVFDNKGLIKQLRDKNEFEFRPAGLSFFAEFTEAINRVEQKRNIETTKISSDNIYADLFDGESEIKTAIQNLCDTTKIEELKNKYIPYSEADKNKKTEVQKAYDELLLASKGKEKEIKNLENVKKLLGENKLSIEELNQYFTTECLTKIENSITDCINKEATAKAEGIEKFKSNKIESIGTVEWKNFIVAAETFAKKQKNENRNYPESGDHCLLCHQPLSKDAENLINNYWSFIKSVAEENAKKMQEILVKIISFYGKLKFDLFPDDNTLTVWLSEKYPKELESIKQQLVAQKALSENIINDVQSKTENQKSELKVDTASFTIIETAIEDSIKAFQNEEQSKKLKELLDEKTYLEHKEKFNNHFSKFETFVNNQIWLKKVYKVNFGKKQVTDTEKFLSNKYFNQKYINTFNEECQKLNGHFGIEINHTGTGGKSYRQLKLKGKNPNEILSEGEQKVIAIADFLAEMHLSEVNRGIIFDDPVTSLDNDRKKQIAERFAEQAKSKQVIIFTHDLVFFYHIKNFSKKYLDGIENCLYHHSVEKDSLFCGKIIANTSPANEGQYHNPTKAEEWLQKSKKSNGNEKVDFAKAGLSALRSSYEALAIFTILGGTVQRFDPQIRMGRLKEIKYERNAVQAVVEKHGEISDMIEGHLPSDEFGVIPSPEILEQQINDFKNIKEQLKNIQ